MPALFDNAVAIRAVSTTATQSLALAADANVLYLVDTGDPAFAAAPTALTYGGVAISTTPLVTNSGDQQIRIYRLISPPTGANDVVVTFGSSIDINFVAASFRVADTAAPDDIAASAVISTVAAGGSALTVAVPSDSAKLAVSILNLNNQNVAASITNAGTKAFDSANTLASREVAIAHAVGATSTDLSWGFSGTGSPRASAISFNVLSSPTISAGTPTGSGGENRTIGFTSTASTGTARIVIDTAANLDAVTIGQVAAGQKETGAAAAYDSGNITVTDTTPEFAFTGLASGTWTAAAVHDGSTVLAWTFTVDATAPVLTTATGEANGARAATGSVTTDTAEGTLYSVLTTSATQPSVAQIKAGQNHSGAAAAYSNGGVTVTATGAQALAASSGLTPKTAYYWHSVHTDAAPNDSNRISSAAFTTHGEITDTDGDNVVTNGQAPVTINGFFGAADPVVRIKSGSISQQQVDTANTSTTITLSSIARGNLPYTDANHSHVIEVDTDE